MELKWAIFLSMSALLSLCGCLDWMAGGNFTQVEFATLRGKIDAFDKTLTHKDMADSAKRISDELNLLWATAWNVVIVYY